MLFSDGAGTVKKDIYEKGTEKYSASYITVENVMLLLQFAAGYMVMRPLTFYNFPAVSVGYIWFVFIMLGFVLRKHLCTGCYYYGKMCHCGWGKLSSFIYRKSSGDYRKAGKYAGLTWGIIMLLPPVMGIVSIVAGKASFTEQLKYFIPLIILTVINGAFHVHDCRNCKMRYICPGSAAKKRD